MWGCLAVFDLGRTFRRELGKAQKCKDFEFQEPRQSKVAVHFSQILHTTGLTMGSSGALLLPNSLWRTFPFQAPAGAFFLCVNRFVRRTQNWNRSA